MRTLSDLVAKERYDELVSTYAAYISSKIQDDRLGAENIHEEPQTSALFGLLASSFWHASILDAVAAASEKSSADAAVDGRYRSKRQWIHQDRDQESAYGFDFGIATHLPNTEGGAGRGRVKITVFQAKRPPEGANHYTIEIKHRVRKGRGYSIPESLEELKEKRESNVQKLEELFKKQGQEDPESVQKKINRMVNSISALDYLEKDWDKHQLPARQKKELRCFRDVLRDENLSDAVAHIQKEADLAAYATLLGEGSLLHDDYSYLQTEAFLALAIRGWTHEKRLEGYLNWCHYVQWVNGDDAESWSANLQSVLNSNGINPTPRNPFSETLANALSPCDTTVGLLLPFEEIGDFAVIASKYSPNLVWGVTAHSKDLAYELLRNLCPQAPDPAPGQQAQADTVEQKPPESNPQSGGTKFSM